jgi:hypothetical protein
VAHTFNPSYSGGRDQEGCSSKPAQANSLQDPISKKKKKKKITKRAGGVVQGEGPEFKPQFRKNKKQMLCDTTVNREVRIRELERRMVVAGHEGRWSGGCLVQG